MGKKSDGYVTGGNVVNFRRDQARHERHTIAKKFAIALAIIMAYVVFQVGFALAVGILHF